MNDEKDKGEFIPAAEVNEAMIAKWKKQYGDVFRLNVGDKVGYVRKIKRHDLKAAMTVAKHEGELGMIESLLTDIFLGGDRELLDDDDYFYGACEQVKDLMQVKEGSLTKL